MSQSSIGVSVVEGGWLVFGSEEEIAENFRFEFLILPTTIIRIMVVVRIRKAFMAKEVERIANTLEDITSPKNTGQESFSSSN